MFRHYTILLASATRRFLPAPWCALVLIRYPQHGQNTVSWCRIIHEHIVHPLYPFLYGPPISRSLQPPPPVRIASYFTRYSSSLQYPLHVIISYHHLLVCSLYSKYSPIPTDTAVRNNINDIMYHHHPVYLLLYARMYHPMIVS